MEWKPFAAPALAALLALAGCTCDEDAPGTPEGTAEATAEVPREGIVAPVEGCGGDLRLLAGDRVSAGGRTLSCGELDQLLADHTIETACLGAISKVPGGRSCIERFVADSRGRSRVLQRGATPPTSGPEAPVEP